MSPFSREGSQFETVNNYSKFDVELSKDEETREAMGMFQLAKEEGREELLVKALQSGQLSLEAIADLFDQDLAYLKQLKANIGQG